jgi:hypothetical protein
MPVLETLAPALATIMMLASAPACPTQGAVDVDVRLEKRDSAYITNLTSQQLTAKYGRDPDSTLSTDGHWMVSGVTVVSEGGLTAQTKMSFDIVPNYKNDTACLTVDKVEYTVLYAPKIYIAQDYKDMGCRYSATLMHEKRHVQTDMRTFTDFFPDIAESIRDSVKRIGAQGPFPYPATPDMQKRAMAQINADLKPVFERLVELRRKRQAEIDTEANYLRDTALCPGQFPKFDGAK